MRRWMQHKAWWCWWDRLLVLSCWRCRMAGTAMTRSLIPANTLALSPLNPMVLRSSGSGAPTTLNGKHLLLQHTVT